MFGMVVNAPLSHKLSICYYNTDDNREQSNKYLMDSLNELLT